MAEADGHDEEALQARLGSVGRIQYDNPLGKPVPEGAMGIVAGYFLPDNDAEMAGLKKQQSRLACMDKQRRG